jgi:hypothetical protein
MSESLERLLQLCKDNPELAKLVEALSIMESLQQSANAASQAQNDQRILSRTTYDIQVTFDDSLRSIHV